MTTLDKNQRKKLAELRAHVDDAKALIARYHKGHTNFDEAYVTEKLRAAEAEFEAYMQVLQED